MYCRYNPNFKDTSHANQFRLDVSASGLKSELHNNVSTLICASAALLQRHLLVVGVIYYGTSNKLIVFQFSIQLHIVISRYCLFRIIIKLISKHGLDSTLDLVSRVQNILCSLVLPLLLKLCTVINLCFWHTFYHGRIVVRFMVSSEICLMLLRGLSTVDHACRGRRQTWSGNVVRV